MPKRRLPIGIQTFRQIRDEDCYYVDKTGYAGQLTDDDGKHYFLSRPRRFGKSLFVDTLKELFEGSEALFRGLAVHDGWDWSRRHPVVRLDFSGGNFRKDGLLEESATAQLEDIGRRTGVGTGGGSPSDVDGTPLYRLGYPNHEVRRGLNEGLLSTLAPSASRRTGDGARLGGLLQASDFAGVEALLRAFFAGIPCEWHMNNDIARYEGYWASVFYAYFAALGFDVAVEDSTSHGRLDMMVRFDGAVYLFELKVVEQAGAGSALAQLEERGYAEKHRAPGRPIHLIGVEFSRETRNIVAFDVEQDRVPPPCAS